MPRVDPTSQKRPGQTLEVIHAVSRGTQAYAVHVLETGAKAIVITTPYRLSRHERYSFKVGRVVQLRHRCRVCGRFIAEDARHFHRHVGKR